MAKPNLALIPATIGDKVYSILPSDGVGDFDFTRASTATRINAQGLIETVASGENRLNYSLLDGEVVGCPHLLLENSATNLIQYSENFSQSVWQGASVTRELNQIISPNGALDGAKLSATVPFSQIQQTYVSVDNTDYTLSVFVKSPSSNVVGLRLASGSNDVRREFNLSTLSIQSMGGNNQELIDEGIENYGNGWYRIFLTCKSDGTSAFLNIYPKNSSDATLQSAYFWGGMLEQNSYPTSYIKTTSAAVTRAAETCNGSGDAATFNDSEGVLMAEISALADDATERRITISNSSNTSELILIEYDTPSNTLHAYLYDGSIQAEFTHTLNDITTFVKVGFKYKANDFALWVNGFEVGTDNIGNVFPNNTLDVLKFENSASLNRPFYGNTKQLQYFDSILDSEQLEQLTSWDSFRAMAEGQLYSIE